MAKKLRYVATMVVEIDISDQDEKDMFSGDFTLEHMKDEMNSDVFDELFQGELAEYKAEGSLMTEDGKVIGTHKVVFNEE